MWHEVRIKVNDLTYDQLTKLSKKIGIPITKVVKYAVYHYIIQDYLKGVKKQ